MTVREPLRQRLQAPRALLAPGVYDALSALLAQQAGFRAVHHRPLAAGLMGLLELEA